MRTVAAKVTSKGQVTIPQEVRERLGLHTGDHVVFRLEEGEESVGAAVEREGGGPKATLRRIPDLLSLAGSMPGPPERRGRPWAEVREAAWEEELRSRR